MNSMTVANTILAQINHADFWARARWGVKQCLGEASALRLHLADGRKVIITLDPSDTYVVAVWKTPRATRRAVANGTAYTPVKLAETDNVYADSLVSVIEGMLAKR